MSLSTLKTLIREFETRKQSVRFSSPDLVSDRFINMFKQIVKAEENTEKKVEEASKQITSLEKEVSSASKEVSSSQIIPKVPFRDTLGVLYGISLISNAYVEFIKADGSSHNIPLQIL